MPQRYASNWRKSIGWHLIKFIVIASVLWFSVGMIVYAIFMPIAR